MFIHPSLQPSPEGLSLYASGSIFGTVERVRGFYFPHAQRLGYAAAEHQFGIANERKLCATEEMFIHPSLQPSPEGLSLSAAGSIFGTVERVGGFYFPHA